MGVGNWGDRRWALGGIGFALALLLLSRSTIQAQAAPAAAAADSASLIVVRSYFAAYNSHDVDAVLRHIAPEFVWLNLAGDSITVELRGADAVRSGLIDYFRRLPTARSDIEAISALGPWVSVRERARWAGANGPRSQAALSVYEVRGGLLRRVWYYPEVRE
ncbi:MAG: nuclear transport factor 2 family protein [Gemmatimonadota bacterium]|nr:nuclear transport factor 2 family protein [Gemmatimonadota bacterium]MDZ4863845.1 nuclear transport factor 2 family protein [Gemmatimonadota bacterium]